LTAVWPDGDDVEWQELQRCKVKKRIVVVALAVLWAASVNAQSRYYSELVESGTPQSKAAVSKERTSK
jgi:hypothetical protein